MLFKNCLIVLHDKYMIKDSTRPCDQHWPIPCDQLNDNHKVSSQAVVWIVFYIWKCIKGSGGLFALL